MSAIESNWDQLTPEERMHSRFERFLAPENAHFVGSETEEKYRLRVQTLLNCILLENRKDRVPVMPFNDFFPAHYTGISYQTAMYDTEEAVRAWHKYLDDFDPDYYLGIDASPSGPFLDILDLRLYRWSGRGFNNETPYQYVDREWMTHDEYPALIDDPSDFWLRVYMPRIFGALKGFSRLWSLVSNFEMPLLTPNLSAWGHPEVLDSLERLMEAGKAARERTTHCLRFESQARAKGFVTSRGGISKAPFDVIGDTLRGTRGIVRDIYQRPEMIIRAIERLTPLMIKMGVDMANASGNPLVFMPLHKGDDGFISDKQFKEFYWPSLKNVVIGLIEAGCVPVLFIEGRYNTRMDYLQELPARSTICVFDRSDLDLACKKLEGIACVAGGVKANMLLFATPGEIKNHCLELIDKHGRRGGFILANGAIVDKCPSANMSAMIEANRLADNR